MVVTCQRLPLLLTLPAQVPQLEVQGADQGCAPSDPVLLRLVCGELHSDHVVGGVACGRQCSCDGGGSKGGREVLQPGCRGSCSSPVQVTPMSHPSARWQAEYFRVRAWGQLCQ